MYLFALIYTFLGSEVCIKFSLYLSTTIKNHFLIVFRERRLQEHGVELLWVKLQDLLTSTADEPRREALIFFEAVIRGQYLQLVSFICTKMTISGSIQLYQSSKWAILGLLNLIVQFY